MDHDINELLKDMNLIIAEKAGWNEAVDQEHVRLDEVREIENAHYDERIAAAEKLLKQVLYDLIGEVAVRILLLGGMNGSRPREVNRYLPWYQVSSIITWTYTNGGHMYNGRLYLWR